MPLQKTFIGLPDLLGMFQGGAVTAEYGGVVTPTIDMLDFLQPPEWVTGQLAVAAIADDDVTVQPDGERWLLHHIGWQTLSTVAFTNSRFDVSANILTESGEKVEIMERNNAISGTSPAGLVMSGMANFPKPLFLQNIQHLRVYAREYGGSGTTTITYGFLITKIGI